MSIIHLLSIMNCPWTIFVRFLDIGLDFSVTDGDSSALKNLEYTGDFTIIFDKLHITCRS